MQCSRDSNKRTKCQQRAAQQLRLTSPLHFVPWAVFIHALLISTQLIKEAQLEKQLNVILGIARVSYLKPDRNKKLWRQERSFSLKGFIRWYWKLNRLLSNIFVIIREIIELKLILTQNIIKFVQLKTLKSIYLYIQNWTFSL